MRARVWWPKALGVVGLGAALATLTFGVGWIGMQSRAIGGQAVVSVSEARADHHYRRLCLPCHGTNGAGDGPAAPWLWPRPRDFVRGEYKWRSTETGRQPLDEDIGRAIRYGVPGTSMPAFDGLLGEGDIGALVARVKQFAPQKFATSAAPMRVASPDVEIDDLVIAGKKAWVELGCDKCHGPAGRGDGPAAADLSEADGTPERPYDLTSLPFRRPRAPDDSATEMIYLSLVTGLTGTPMPSFSEAADAKTLWAVAAYVAAISPPPDTAARNRSIAIDDNAADLDRVRTGYWPGTPSDPDALVWGHTLEAQRDPPAALAPAQASLSADQCARCHAKQSREWRETVHGGASSPGLIAQLIEVEASTDSDNASYVEGCLRCHAPLAEQHATLRPGRWGGDDRSSEYRANPLFDSALQEEGINCASCHVRSWTRHGPPKRSGSGLLAQDGYPLIESDYYERSDFCLGCHQLTPSNRLGQKPLLNTYIEWLAGPYFARGIQCQHCHMPNREHTWKGVHDPQTFRQGISVAAVSRRSAESVSVRVRMTNIGAGHYLPTTPTPAAFIDVELLDELGRPIEGASATKRIGRHIVYEDDNGWVELEDSRIAPGESAELAAAWKDGRTASATHLLVTVRVEPDEYYERLYRGELDSEITERQRQLYVAALARAEASHFIALTRRFRIE